MSLKVSCDPFPADPIAVYQAAQLVRVSVMALNRRLLRGQLRHWRDRGGRLVLSRAEVMKMWPARAPAGPALRQREVMKGRPLAAALAKGGTP